MDILGVNSVDIILSFVVALIVYLFFFVGKCALQSYFPEGSRKMRLMAIFCDEGYLLGATSIFNIGQNTLSNFMMLLGAILFFALLQTTLSDFSRLFQYFKNAD